MNKENSINDKPLPTHELIYRGLRSEILGGLLNPGQVLTLRSLAKKFNVSTMPVREAARRLVAEGALVISSSGRIFTPKLTNERIEELASLKSNFGTRISFQSTSKVYDSLIERLVLINCKIEEMIVKKNATGYIKSNLEFHRTLYLRAQAPSTLALVETIWLQYVPMMRALYDDTSKVKPPIIIEKYYLH